jgi:hypothetical protein
MTGAKVGRGKVLTPPLDHTGMDLPPSSVRRHIRPPPIRGPIEVHAYTDSDDDEEEKEPNDVASLREQLAALRLCLNNMDERVAETEIDRMELGIGWIPFARQSVLRSNALRRRPGMRISIDPRIPSRCRFRLGLVSGSFLYFLHSFIL